MLFKEKIELTLLENIAIIKLVNPPANALSEPVIDGLSECLDEIEKSKDIRAAIITGEGKFFVGGADIKEFLGISEERLIERTRFGQKVFSRIESMGIPFIAAINGFALGGGLELALVCDVRVAASTALMGLPELSLGILPGYGGVSRLPKLIGEGHAKKMIFTTKPVDAKTALEIGLVQQVADYEQLMDECIKLAKQMASAAPIPLRLVKEGILKGRTISVSESLENEVKYSVECYHSKDRTEGVNAFLNKQKPKFMNE